MDTDVDSLLDLTSVLRVSEELNADEISLEQNIKSISSKRTQIDMRLTDLSYSIPDFRLIQSNSRNLSSMIGLASELALELSGKIRQLDLVKTRVMECVTKLDSIVNLKVSASEAEKALKQERFEEAARYINNFLNTDKEVLELTTKLTTDTSARDSVLKLNTLREQLIAITEKRFDHSLHQNDRTTIERFGKIFPLIGKREEGLERFAVYLCALIAKQCNGLISLAELPDSRSGVAVNVHLDLLTQMFEFIAETVRDNQVYVETHYGPGSMFTIASAVQKQCDSLVERVLDRFRSQHHLSELTRMIQPIFAPTVSAKLHSSTGHAPASNVTSATDSTQLEHTLALEPVITEIVLMSTRVELYLRFMRRRVMADAQHVQLSEEEHNDKSKQVTALFDNCQTVRQMQELIGTYISLEGHYLREMIITAVASDELDDSTKTLRFADDVFFILKQCLGRSVSSASVDGICAMLNHACSILLDNLISNVLAPRIRAGFPSGWMQDAYNYMQSSVAAVTPVASTTAALGSATGTATSSGTANSGPVGSGNVARHQFLVMLNTMETCRINLDTLCSQLERDLSTLIEKLDSPSSQKLQDDLDLNAINDPWVEACVTELENFVKPFRVVLSNGNNDRLVSVLTTELVRRMESLIQRKTYSRFGAVQLEKEMRYLFAYLSGITYTTLRDHFTRLLQICNLLNLDKVRNIFGRYGISTLFYLLCVSIEQKAE
ncbi:hypothetical protein P879_08246 [Paragonimus westermani]|uniref:Conserved oligomeric Golgi complex subunit 4 n=1 Tax=Paragonimus westermani TaxID=34504 RepID=A0A8T0D8T7_9TREM|nr:hypothetical protein P879_08246 [Paragonimus westermani]